MSLACPWVPPMGWWIMTLEFGKVILVLGAIVALLGYRYLAARLDARLDKQHHS